MDEFQDTSPLQLQLFTKFAELVEKVVWVGDSKQAIYEFRGTDPELMKAVAAHVEGLACSTLDFTGLSQKNGAVMSHVRIAPEADDLATVRIAPGGAHLILGCDIVVATSIPALMQYDFAPEALSPIYKKSADVHQFFQELGEQRAAS